MRVCELVVMVLVWVGLGWASVAVAGEGDDGGLIEYKVAAKEVGEGLKAELEEKCKKRVKKCLIEVVPITKTAGLSHDDLDLILLNVMDPLREFRFWASDDFRKQTKDRLQTLSIYDPGATMKFLRSGRGERYQLTCSLTQIKRENKVDLSCALAVMASIVYRKHAEFHHPDHIQAMREQADQREQERRAQEAAREKQQEEDARRTERMWNIIWIAGGALILALVCIGVLLAWKKTQKRRFLEALPRVKEQIQVHLERGQFIAAEELIRRALLAVPEDTELLGAGNRLQIVTQGDARKAEEAWVKVRWAKELHGRKREHELLPALAEMKALAPHNPELAEICTDLDRTRQALEREQALAPRFEEVELLRGQGKLAEAGQKVDRLLGEVPSSQRAAALAAGIKLDREESARRLAEGRDKLLQGRFSEAEQDFALALEKDRSLSEARHLVEDLARAKIDKGLKLVPRGAARAVHLCCQDTIGCGRELAEISIDDHLVSREHCTVSLRQGQVMVEDQGSKNGTFVRGERITSDTLQDGDELSLAEAHDFLCRIHKAGGAVQAVVLEGEVGAFVILQGRLPARLCCKELAPAGPDDELILLAREGRKSVLFHGKHGLVVLAPGKKVTIAGIDYYVEVLQ